MGKNRRWVVAVASAAALVAGCGGNGGTEAVLVDVTTPPTSPPTTAAPAPEPAPTAAPRVLVTSTGVIVPILGGQAGAWRVRSPCGKERLVAAGTPVSQATIVLDPGHGGGEPGAVGPDGQAEGPLNLDVARRARTALEGAGVSVVLTRAAEYEVSLAVRGEIATSLQPRAFVSIHHNAEPDGPSARPGTETYYQLASPDSKRLAGLIYEEVLRALSAYRVAWVSDTDAGAKYRRGAQGDYYAVLRLPGAVTSVLSEAAFISNPAESQLLARPEVRQAEAEAIARGILRYLNSDDPGSGYVEPYPRATPPGAGGATPCRDPAL